MKDFMKIEGLGNLKTDVVLFESYYPILFTCVNEKKENFLCVCCQSNSQGRKWLITKTTPKTIINLLKNKILLRKAFLEFEEVQISVLMNGNEVSIKRNDKADWDFENSKVLPDKEEYLDSEEGEFDEEILYYESLRQIEYKTINKTIEIRCSNEQLKGIYTDILDEIDTFEIEYKLNDIGLKNSGIYKQIISENTILEIAHLSKIEIRYNELYNLSDKKLFKNQNIPQEYIDSEILTELASNAA